MQLLVVDDNEFILEAIGDCLEDAGFEVTRAISAEDAIAKASSATPGVLVTDLDLGAGMSGIDLGVEAQRRWPGLPVIYISGRPWLMNGHALCGWDAFLSKPFRNRELLHKVACAAERNRKVA